MCLCVVGSCGYTFVCLYIAELEGNMKLLALPSFVFGFVERKEI